MSKDNDAVIKFWVEATIGARGSFKTELMRSAFERGIELHLQEAKGWLATTYYITAKGNADILTRWQRDVFRAIGALQ